MPRRDWQIAGTPAGCECGKARVDEYTSVAESEGRFKAAHLDSNCAISQRAVQFYRDYTVLFKYPRCDFDERPLFCRLEIRDVDGIHVML